MQSPVVMIVFNRPDLARRVFERVRAARPPKLIVVCDGPRASKPTDAERVAAVRDIFERIDWPCDVIREYADSNLGCMDRVHTGINRAFAEVEEAVILEDDCLPDPSFFRFCDEMLQRFRDDPRVMNVGGTNFLAPYVDTSDSYWFSRHPWTWGWATWRRAWDLYDFHYNDWETGQSALRASYASAWERQYWISTLDAARRNPRAANTWDFQWNFTCRINGGLSIVPRNNLVSNLGFGSDPTHTAGDMSRLAVETQPLEFPLQHPEGIEVDRYRDELLTRVYAGEKITVLNNLESRIRLTAERLRS
ncbi:MAG: glycosyltransferase family A protein [Nibricoccus sp.]